MNPESYPYWQYMSPEQRIRLKFGFEPSHEEITAIHKQYNLPDDYINQVQTANIDTKVRTRPSRS